MNRCKIRWISWTVIGIVFLLGFLTGNAHAVEPGADVVGKWETLPYTMPINPIHVALLRPDASGNVKVLVVAGSESDPTSTQKVAAILDLTLGTVVVKDIEWDLFCNGMSFLPDGRVFITGGTNSYAPVSGEAYTITYDPITGVFEEKQEMYEGRFYPSNVVLSDGRTLTISGLNKYNQRSQTMEIYDPASETWTFYPLPFIPGYYLYPRLILLPNKRVVYIEKATPPMREFNPVNHTWRAFTLSLPVQPNGSSVLLPLVPPYYHSASRILIAGGGNQSVVNSAGLIRPVDPVSWTAVAPLKYMRTDQNTTLLPNSHVLVTGGATRHQKAEATGVRQAEWFNPAKKQWTTLATALYEREYHSVALLLPDARVLTAGSNPVRGHYEDRMEIYSPPYLFTRNSSGAVVPAVQPTISTIPATIRYNRFLTIFTPDANSIDSVMIIRPGAVTHSVDMEQRGVELSFTRVSSNRLSVKAPPNSAVAPKGYYMVFLIDKRGVVSVPSVAKWTQLIN